MRLKLLIVALVLSCLGLAFWSHRAKAQSGDQIPLPSPNTTTIAPNVGKVYVDTK